MILGFLAMTVGGLIEAVYLGQVGPTELAVIAFALPVTMSLNALVRGVGVGSAALLAQAAGAADHSAMVRVTSHCLMLLMLVAAGFSLLGIAFAPTLFTLLGAQGEVLTKTVSYVRLWLLAFPVFAFALVAQAQIRALGDARYPGLVMSSGPVTQVIVGPFLIFGWAGLPRLELTGAALAFAVGACVQFAIALVWLLRARVVEASVTRFLQSDLWVCSTLPTMRSAPFVNRYRRLCFQSPGCLWCTYRSPCWVATCLAL